MRRSISARMPSVQGSAPKIPILSEHALASMPCLSNSSEIASMYEGVTMMTNIVDCDLDALAIGQRVELVFKAAEGGAMLPMFRPAG